VRRVEPCQGGDSSRMLFLLSRHDSHATDEIGEAWVRAKRIDAGKTGGEILYFASEPTAVSTHCKAASVSPRPA